MSAESNLNAQSDLQAVSSNENLHSRLHKMSSNQNAQLPVSEDKTASEETDELTKIETGTLKSSSKKHKRKLTSCDENDIPAKIGKNDANLEVNTKCVKIKKTKSDKLTINTGSLRGKKHPLYDLDDSFQPPSKKIKSETDILRQDDGKKKHVRRRTKYLLQAVVDQMEFYFGDSNLSKDRFLRKMIDNSPDGYVDLSLFGNFNKLQSLHKDGVSMKVLSAAIRKSRMLQLNSDGTKVNRTTPIKEISQGEIDSRTVYVEHLPAHANHMWLRSIFCQCGKVVYVSLPVYKTTRMIKGFAFVEFETSEEAAKACMMLNNPLPVKLEEKPGKFPKGNKTLNRLQKIAPVKIEQGSDEENAPSCEKTEARQAGAGAASKKKKKKNPKKKKVHDSASDDNSTKSSIAEAEQTEKKVEQAEGKKKKKKKKKKQNQPQDGKSNKDGDIKSNMECNELTSAVDVCLETTDATVLRNELVPEDLMKTELTTGSEMLDHMDGGEPYEGEKSIVAKTPTEDEGLKKKKNKKKRKSEKKQEKKKEKSNIKKLQLKKLESTVTSVIEAEQNKIQESTQNTEATLSRKERKRLRQEDIRKKKQEREGMTVEKMTNISLRAEDDAECNNLNLLKDASANDKAGRSSTIKEDLSMLTSDIVDNEIEDKSQHKSDGSEEKCQRKSDGTEEKCQRKSDGSELTSILKSKKGQEKKKVEFDPVPVTNEFVKGREIRKRKKPKKEKIHLRVITKEEWLSLKAEYIAQQKSHMAALKESLRELRQQENQGKPQVHKRVDLEDVFGTKRLKPSQDLKMAHVESLKFTPNVIVQWKCSHDMHRDKIRTMFKEMSGDSIAYIDAKEEAKFGYIRFKDEASAEEFAKLSRRSTSFMARILPAEQQEDYWKRANEDRMKKLGRKKHEKGSEKIARKVFERNKATFFQKPNHVVFNDDDDDDTKVIDKKISIGESRPEESHLQDDDQLPTAMDAQLSTA